MYRLTVCYGQPTDPGAFDEHYAQVHIPLVRAVPGLAGYTGGRCATHRSQPAAYYYVAALEFATEADYRAALSSPEMVKTSADVATFATGGVTMFTQELDDLMAG